MTILTAYSLYLLTILQQPQEHFSNCILNKLHLVNTRELAERK